MRSLVLIADDPATVRRVRTAVRSSAGLRVVAALDPGTSAAEALARLRPDVVLVEQSCQRMNTILRLREASLYAPTATLMMLAAKNHAPMFDDAFGLGVRAIVSPEVPAPALAALLGNVAQGHLLLGTDRSIVRSESVEAPEIARLRVVRDQDARGTRSSA